METIHLERGGRVFWNDQLLSADELNRRVAQPGHGGIVVYLESPELPPSAEQTGVMELLQRGGWTIDHGLRRPSEWGTLEWFEMEETPQVMRLALIPRQPILFAGTIRGRLSTWMADVDAAQRASFTSEVDYLIRANRVIETKPDDPEKAFAEDTRKMPALHIRIAYVESGRWQACFRSGKLPPSIQAFQQGCIALGMKRLASSGKEMSPAAALEMLRKSGGK